MTRNTDASPPRSATDGSATAAPRLAEPLRRPWLLKLAVLLTGGWTLALAGMVALLRPEQVLSRDQVLRADVVVIARLTADGGDRMEVEEALHGPAKKGETLAVLNLSRVPRVDPETSYIVPLTFFRQDYTVTELDRQRDPPRIYAATSAARRQARDWLRAAGK